MRNIVLALVPTCLIAGLIGAEALSVGDSRTQAAMAAQLPPAGYGPSDQRAASEAVEERLAFGTERVDADPDEWLPRQVLARALIRSYATNGDFDALADAGVQLRLAQDRAIAGSGPHLTAAEWAMSVHDLDLAAANLDSFDGTAVKLTASEIATAHALRGDLEFYNGNMDAALETYDTSADVELGPAILVRQAIVMKARGEFDAAIALIARAARADSLRTPKGLADLALQAGTIEFARGEHDRAHSWYRQADLVFPGYWKTKLYIGEYALVQGHPEQAAQYFQAVVEQNQAPEAMDALAMLYRKLGDRSSSRQWSERAAREWDRRIDILATASRAHAAEHELAFGSPARALGLARRNLTERPYGEARILMAKALIASGRPNSAIEQLRLAEKDGWRSAMLYVELARALDATGDSSAAAIARDEALELNPKVFSPAASGIWFAHG